MIVKKERLIQLLYHEDKRVRYASIHALDKFFYGTDGVIEHVLETFPMYEKDLITFAMGLRSFKPTTADIKNIIKVFNENKENEDENSINLIYNILRNLVKYPFELIEKHKELFMFDENLKRTYEQAEFRESIRSQDPDTLWNELYDVCEKYNNKDLKGEDSIYANILYEGLKKHPDHIRHKIIMFLSHGTQEKYYMEEYMVRLAGIHRIEETIPYLFRIYNDSDFMHRVNDMCVHSLGRIGTLRVVEEVEKQYNPDNESRDGLVNILGLIPLEISENLLIRFLGQEKDIRKKSYIASDLCGMFSIKALEPIKEMIEKEEYDPSYDPLCEALVPVYVYHDEPYDLSSLESLETKYIEECKKNNPFHQRFEPLRTAFQQYKKNSEGKNPPVHEVSNETQPRQIRTTKIGRNDPCPCGSGKKYKKCCLLKNNT